jgi:hypothetical protein
MGQLCHDFRSVHFGCHCDRLVIQLLGFDKRGIELARVLQLGTVSVELEPDRWYPGSSKLDCQQLLPNGARFDEQLYLGKCVYMGGGTWC